MTAIATWAPVTTLATRTRTLQRRRCEAASARFHNIIRGGDSGAVVVAQDRDEQDVEGRDAVLERDDDAIVDHMPGGAHSRNRRYQERMYRQRLPQGVQVIEQPLHCLGLLDVGEVAAAGNGDHLNVGEYVG